MPDDAPMPALMTAREVAAAARVELATIHRRVQRKLAPHPVRVGRLLRFRREEVRAWLSGEEQGP